MSVNAQQLTGAPGSPSATTTIDGKQLPAPDPKFGVRRSSRVATITLRASA
jgi:hypothetical protein